MNDIRTTLGYQVEGTITGPFSIMAADKTNPEEGGILDRGITAYTKDGKLIVIGEIWARCPGEYKSVRINAQAIAQAIIACLNTHFEKS